MMMGGKATKNNDALLYQKNSTFASFHSLFYLLISSADINNEKSETFKTLRMIPPLVFLP